jgi:hypothetical protein
MLGTHRGEIRIEGREGASGKRPREGNRGERQKSERTEG